MKNKKLFFLVPIFTIVFIFVIFAFNQPNNPSSNGIQNSISYGSNPCISTTGDFEGRETPLGEMELISCSSNVLYNTGAEGIEAYLGAGTGGGDAFDWIELCNATSSISGCGVPLADKSEEYLAYAACGLSNVAGTYTSVAGNGNWTIHHEFTATCDNLEINATRLRNDDDDDLAGNNFTLTTLQTNDKILINWSIFIL